MGYTETYVRTNEAGSKDLVVVRVDGDEVTATYFTGADEAAVEWGPRGGPGLWEYLLDGRADDGYVKVAPVIPRSPSGLFGGGARRLDQQS